MARAVTLYFKNDDAAKEFVQEIDAGAKFEGDEDPLKDFFEITGVYPVPTMFCDPSDPIHKGKGKTGRGYTKGTKWGWWVCAVCKKPHGTRNMELLIRSVIGQAVNLLDQVRGAGDPKVTT